MSSKSYRDALVGAVFDNPEDKASPKKLIITSPNMVALPYFILHQSKCTVTFFDDGRCGRFDYLLNPQVYHTRNSHFPLITCPDATAPYSSRAIIHQRLDPENDWRPSSWSNPEYGTINDDVREPLDKLLQDLIREFRAAVKKASEHTSGSAKEIHDLNTRRPDIDHLVVYSDRLKSTALFPTCVHVWSQCQRLYLEIRAFMDFMTIYGPLFRDLPTSPRPVDLDRLGAITREPTIAHNLFMAGLPCYLVREQAEVDLSKVQRLLRNEEVLRCLEERGIVRSGHQAGAKTTKVIFVPKHTKPPQLCIYIGEPGSINMYLAIIAWTRKAHPLQSKPLERTSRHLEDLVKYGLSNQEQSGAMNTLLPPPGSTASAPQAKPTTLPSAPSNPHRRGKKGKESIHRSLPAAASSSSTLSSGTAQFSTAGLPPRPIASTSSSSAPPSSKTPALPTRDKWVTTSDWMPKCIDVWEAASRKLGQGHVESILPTWPSAKTNTAFRGYCVPEAGLIASLPDEQRSWALYTVARLFGQLELLVHWNAVPWKNTEWRRLLTLGFTEYKSSLDASARKGFKAKTTTSQLRDDALSKLNLSLQYCRSPDSFSSNMLLEPVQWRGIRFKRGEAVSQENGQKVLAHLNELEFRCELANLDNELFNWDKFRSSIFPRLASQHAIDNPDAPPLEPWTPLIRRGIVRDTIVHFNGSFIPDAAFYQHHRGFAAEDLHSKVVALSGLARIMVEWTPPHGLDEGVFFELGRLTAVAVHELLRVGPKVTEMEQRVAEHYVRCYKDVYSRAPVLPHDTRYPL